MTTEERFENTFIVGENPRLSVSNVKGSITVQSEERDDIQVTAVKQLHGCENPERTEIKMAQDGDCVVVKTSYREGDDRLSRWRGKNVCAVDYTVQVPADCDVDVNQVTGTVRVSGISGRVTVDAVQGAVDLREITGRTQVKAVSATVDGTGWRGRADMDTVSGPVKIAGAQLARVKANTVSGDLSLETTVDENGKYVFHSVSGDVTLLLPSERGVESRGSTISGHLLCDLPHEFTHRSLGGWRATINGGGPPLRFNSVSGDLEVLAT